MINGEKRSNSKQMMNLYNIEIVKELKNVRKKTKIYYEKYDEVEFFFLSSKEIGDFECDFK